MIWYTMSHFLLEVFIPLSGIFHSLLCIHFISFPRLVHNHPGRFFISILLLSPGYFITTQADFSYPFHYLPWLFHIHFITCPRLFHIHFIACPGLSHILAWAISYHGPLGPTLMLIVSHSLLTVFRFQKCTSKYGNMHFSKWKISKKIGENLE